MNNFNIEIPKLTDTKVKVFYDNKFIGEATNEQVNKIRISIVEYILNSGDLFVLDKFYLVGHKDSNKEMSEEEIKVTMDKYGNLSDLPWEMAHTRRDLY